MSQNKKLYVGSLPYSLTEEELRDFFAPFGEVVSARIINDKMTGKSKGFGFVEMADKMIAFDAIDNIDGTFFDGNIISVKEAKQNTTTGGRPGAGSSGGNRPFKPRTTPRPGGNGYNNSRY